GTAKNLARRVLLNRRKRIAERAGWERVMVVEDCGDSGELVYVPIPPDVDPGLFSEGRPVPMPPGFLDRHTAAWRAWVDAEEELERLYKEAEELGDECG